MPILRAGLVLLENAQTVIPSSETYHLGLVRDEKTLLVSSSSLPNTAQSSGTNTHLLCFFFFFSLHPNQPTEYLNKLPDSFSPDDKILVSDPMLATGMCPQRLSIASSSCVPLCCCCSGNPG